MRIFCNYFFLLVFLIYDAHGHTPLRLEGGKTKYEGRVEIFHNDHWGTLCGKRFDDRDAKVICRMLGKSVDRPIIFPGFHFGAGNGTIWLSDIECVGHEADISLCGHNGWASSSCGHGDDVGLKCDIQVRLSNGSSLTEGRVEVLHDNIWGTVCSTNFDVNDAKVVCRMLGYENAQAQVYPSSKFQRGRNDIWMDNLACTGNELDISNCSFSGWGKSNCTHNMDVGISCATQVRLLGGHKPSEGRVQVYHSGSWGTICDDMFDIRDAMVLCRTLGFSPSYPIIYKHTPFGGFSSGTTIHMDDLQCLGTETDIANCRFSGWGKSDCSYDESVSLSCDTDIRTRNITGQVLEVKINGLWGAVCFDGFGYEEAIVACRMLGYKSTQIQIHSSNSLDNTVLMRNVNCSGVEYDIHQCQSNTDLSKICQNTVVLKCLLDTTTIHNSKLQLTHGSYGTIRVKHNGVWGSVCDDGFDVADGNVVCRTLGYHAEGTLIRGNGYFGQLTGKILMDDMGCSGQETDFFACSFPGWGQHNCGHGEDVGVVCEGVRLANGKDKTSGRLEILRDKTWVTVCDVNFGKSEALVICSILGIQTSDPLILKGAAFGAGSGNQYIVRGCSGSENSIDSCTVQSASSSPCGSHAKDVSISCNPISNLRLVNGSSTRDGLVEVYYLDRWITICSGRADVNTARVICNTLGYKLKYAKAYKINNGTPVNNQQQQHMFNLRCTGNENHIRDCSKSVETQSCADQSVLGVSCETRVRLVNTTSNMARGRLEINYNGNWGTMCEDDFDANEAKVICQMLGYENRHATVIRGDSDGVPFIKDNLECTGEEDDISLCTFKGWISSQCSNKSAVWIDCRIPVRLIGGNMITDGRLELMSQGKWHSICNRNFTKKEATVACRSLGYMFTSPEIQTAGQYGLSRNTNMIDNIIKCSGFEEFLSECEFEATDDQLNCSNVDEVAVACSGHIRLRNGVYKNEGRLEIQRNGTWGTVCSDNFDISESRVICSMLGFDNPFPEICTKSCFGHGNLQPIIANLNCTGNAIDVSQCSYNKVKRRCTDILGIFCRTQVRLVDGTNPSEGRLQVKHNNAWGTVCENKFEESEARVICRMLGYDTEHPLVYIGDHFQINGSGPIWIDNLQCWGTEDDLGQCDFSPWGKNNCTHQQDVGVACGINIRLVDGTSYNEGRVEIFHAGEWGTICENQFTESEGQVVCRMLGLDTENVTVISSAIHGNGNQNIRIEGLGCTGREPHIAACKFHGWGHIRCSGDKAVGVICGGTRMRLVGSRRPSEGRLEILHNNAWGTVCSDNFDNTDAATVCRILGYKTNFPYAIGGAFFGEGTGRVWLDNINCNGTEDDIFKCKSTGWGATNCGHSKDVSIICDTMVRLVDGTKPANGRIEIFHNGFWGTICDNTFDQGTASVVCTMLGYNNSDAVIYPNAYFGEGRGQIFLSDLRCDGIELDLERCQYTSWKNSSCSHKNDISIDCATPVRLFGGRGPFEGTIELFHFGSWGEVCDTNFDARDAKVICKMLGYTSRTPRLLNSTTYGTGLVWMKNLECNGEESDIALCKSGGFGSKSCSLDKKAAIYCGQDIQVRIHGGKGAYEGNIEILDGKTWQHICKEGFNMDAAKVVCRTLGFPDSIDPDLLNINGRNVIVNSSDSGKRILCSGFEADVGLCQITEVADNCSQQSLRCPRIAVRLTNGTTPNEGRIEVLHNGQWGMICGRGFQRNDARVLCKMMGMQHEEELFVKGEFGSSNGPMLLERLSCTGNENDIAGCLLNWKAANCTGQGAVGIRCGTTPIRLVGGGGPWEGRVEVMHNGQWGTVCDTGFGNEEAQVVCKMLGFLDGTTDAYAKNTSFYGPSDKTIYLDQLSCTGTELDINGCRTKEWGYHTCDNNHEAGVLCKATNVRLSGGSHTMEGRVEIMKDGTWSTLCDDGWVDNEATIICKMLTPYPLNRLIFGKAFTESYFGAGSGVASLSNLKCNGTEVDLLHCSMDKDGRPHCDHSHDAGVSCSLNSTSYIVGKNNNQGTLQTQIANFAGTICGINVQDIAGSVICKSLGYWMNTATLFKNSWFGPGNGMSFNLQPECSGKETNIVFCRLKNTFGKINCDHSNDVGVKCTAIPLGLNNIRLALGNSKGDGRLEIKYNNKWGTVCSEDWTLQNSKAVCRMLGYQNRTFQSNAIKRNNSAVVLGSLNCMGFENDIGFCKGGLDKSNCTNDIVNIDCTGGMQMKLSGGSSPAEGRVDILDNGQWGSLCDRSFGIAELQVMCSMLGYRDTLPYLYHLPSLELHRSAFGIDQLTCSGLEDHIAQCPFSTIASCHHKYAHLKCFDCVQQYYSTTGNIMSDNYPGRYNQNTDCLYIIQPPSGLYRLSIDVLQMADTGDFLQIKESPFGKELGYYSVSSYIPVALSEQFWIRFKTNGQRSARGFKLHWSPFDFKDLLSLNCELSRWGAAVNITLLHMANISVNYSDIYMTDPDCFGTIVGDKLLFNQLYDECGSTKNVSHFYFTYHNNITFISEGVVHEIPLECQLFKDDRIIHYHNVDGTNELDDESYNGLEDDLFHVELYYDLELTETKDKQFNGKFVYKIATEQGSYSPHPLLTNCVLSTKRNDYEEKMQIIENNLPKLDNVKVRYLGNGVIVLEVPVPENVPSYLECNVAWT